MGHYAFAECSISLRTCFSLAKKFKLPKPKPNEDKETYFLTAKDILKWSKAISFELDMWIKSPLLGIDKDIIYLSQAVNIFQEDAQNYISGCAIEANKLNIPRKKRKDWFRKKTNEYRLIFA